MPADFVLVCNLQLSVCSITPMVCLDSEIIES